LRAAFEAIAGGEENWGVNPAQVYTTLTRMENAGLVAAQSVEQGAGPEKHIYVITPSGRRALDEWFATGVASEHQHDEFFIMLMLALASGAADPYQLISTQRTLMFRQLHAVTEQRTRVDPTKELAKLLLLDKVAMHLDADLRWLDMTESRLDEIRRQPLPEPETKPRGRPRKDNEAKPSGDRPSGD
jgi:DNA-binding PadR family transcriptional regulator